MHASILSLQARLAQPLPGLAAQLRMASSFRGDPSTFGHNAANVRQSAVLIVIFPVDGVLTTVLTKRHDYDGAHSGQVSFPGGRSEPTDVDLAATALREANEEVGIAPTEVQLLGRLTELYIPASNFMMHPFVGYLNQRPLLVPDPREVKQILEVPLTHFYRTDIVSETQIKFKSGFSLMAPYFDVEGHVVWGATAMVLSELRQVLTEAQLA